MTLEFVGHACFVITLASGKVVVMDPYRPQAFGGALRYRALTTPADYVLVSHGHADHDGYKDVPGNPEVIRTAGEHRMGEITVVGVPTFHDKRKGKERGDNLVFALDAEGVRVVHLGDLGHLLEASQVEELRPVSVLLVPVGGHFTVDAEEAWTIVETLRPRVVIPMHYKTPAVDFPIAGVEGFLRIAEAHGVPVKRFSNGKVEIPPLPETTEVWVLDPTHLP